MGEWTINEFITPENVNRFLSLLNRIKARFAKVSSSKDDSPFCTSCICFFYDIKEKGELTEEKGYSYANELINIKQSRPTSIIISYLLAEIYLALKDKPQAKQHSFSLKKIAEDKKESRLIYIADRLSEKAHQLA